MRYLPLLLFVALLIGCSGETPEDLNERVNQLIAEDNYPKAITLLEDANPDETEADIPEREDTLELWFISGIPGTGRKHDARSYDLRSATVYRSAEYQSRK